jgi:hypothetical protein
MKIFDVKEKFFRWPARRGHAIIPTSETLSEETLAELEGWRECIKRCVRKLRGRNYEM